MILEIINKPEMIDFCSLIKKHHLNKRAKVIGLDIKEDYLNFKLYTELLNFPEEEIINSFLEQNCAEEFKKYLKMWDPQRESGLAFGLKIDTLNNIKKYFHVKFKQSVDFLLFKNQFLFLNLLKINPLLLNKGISYEISSDLNFYKKFYVYVENPDQIKNVLSYKKKLFNLNIEEIQELEIYATSNKIKINIVNKNDNFLVKQNIWQTVPDKFHSILKEYSKILNSDPMYTGFTSEELLSVYFSFTNKKDNILNI